MSLSQCPFCEHGNLEDAKYCSECGGALHLAPCPHCGAVSLVTATACYQCHGPLSGRKADAFAPEAFDVDAFNADVFNADLRDPFSPGARSSHPLSGRNMDDFVPSLPIRDVFNPLAGRNADALNPTSRAAEVVRSLSKHKPGNSVPSVSSDDVFRPLPARNERACDPILPVAEVFAPVSERKPDGVDPVLPAAQVFRPLQERKLDPFNPSPTATGVAEVEPRRLSRTLAGAAILTLIAAVGVYAYHQRSLFDTAQPPGAISQAEDRVTRSGTGVIRRDAATGGNGSPTANKSARATSAATLSSTAKIPTAAEAAANQALGNRQPAHPAEARAGGAVSVRSQATNAGRASSLEPPSTETCTEALAALGTCTLKPAQKKAAARATVVEEATKLPPMTGAGTAAGQEAPRSGACTQAVAALGLCTLDSTQRSE